MNEAALKDFKIVDKFLGYKNKRDVTKESPGIAVSGSQNIIIIDGEKIGVRPGYAYVGGRSTDRYGIQGGGSWKTSSGTEIMWRSFFDGTNGTIEVKVNNIWYTLNASLTAGDNPGKFRSTTWWSTTEVQDLLILLNGSSNIYSWSGGIGTYVSATTNTITGVDVWSEKRFLVSGTRQVRIQDSGGTWRTFTYTGGEGTATLTGVTPDPTVYTFTPGAVVLQEIVTTSNQPSATLSNDFAATYLNYLFVFDEKNRVVQMSKNSNFADFSAPTNPRLPGEAASFTLDDQPTAAIVQSDGEALYISTKNQWYQVVFTPSADLTTETVTIEPLQTSPLGGATNSLALANIKGLTLFVSSEPTIDTLGNIENVSTPKTLPLSDDIKNTMDSAGATRSSIGYYKNNSYIAINSSTNSSTNNRILIRNQANQNWETPWTIPALTVFEHEANLYAHDPSTKNTYQLLDDQYSDGRNDTTLGAPISAKWFSAHENYGLPFNQKKFNKMWIDGYIRPNTTIKVYFIYDFGRETKSFSIVGTKEEIIIDNSGLGGGLGTYSLGQRNLGSRGQTLSATGLKRFRGFIDIPENPFYELQVSFQSDGAGFRWEIVQYGLNVTPQQSQNNNLKIN